MDGAEAPALIDRESKDPQQKATSHISSYPSPLMISLIPSSLCPSISSNSQGPSKTRPADIVINVRLKGPSPARKTRNARQPQHFC